MAALSPVAGSVTPKNNSGNAGETDPTIETGIAGEAFDAGDLIYQKSSDSKYYKAYCTEEATTDISNGGIAICPADDADDAAVFVSGDGDRVDLGVAATEDETYYVGTTAGDIIPSGDLASGNYKGRIGYGNKAGELVIDKKVTGETHT